MPINPLSELNPNSHHWTVQVYVSRLWQHRGGTDDGPIKHTDIVFQDTQGNHMYGEIPADLVASFIDRLQEGKVYVLTRFLVSPKKHNYRPVEGQFMMRLGRYTTVQEINDNIMDYPLCTYSLTAIDQLPRPTEYPERFTDVIGIITGVSPISQYHTAARSTPSTKRIIQLSDLSGYEISLVLWGERALAFNGEGVLQSAEKGPVVAIFVGTLIKPFENRRGLSGSAPCRWYINEDLPEINELHTRLSDKVPSVQNISVRQQTAAEISAQVDLETKTVNELVTLNIYDHEKTRFFCTVVIRRLSPAQRWWFTACTTCNKSTVPYGSAYRCPASKCDGVGGMPRYRLCYIGADDTDEIEFIFFEKTGKELIGKPLMTILRAGISPAATMEEVIQAAREDQSTPRELSAVVARKYRFVVSVTTKSFDPTVKKPSYQVHRIDASYGKQTNSSALRRNPGLAIASSSKNAGNGLNSLGEELAEAAILGVTSASDIVPRLSDAPDCTDGDGSVFGSGTTVPQTPLSVVKPPAFGDPKGVDRSSVQRALFPETGPFVQSEEELDSSVVSDATNPPTTSTGTSTGTDPPLASTGTTTATDPPAPSTGATTNNRRKLPKAQSEATAKKKKN